MNITGPNLFLIFISTLLLSVQLNIPSGPVYQEITTVSEQLSPDQLLVKHLSSAQLPSEQILSEKNPSEQLGDLIVKQQPNNILDVEESISLFIDSAQLWSEFKFSLHLNELSDYQQEQITILKSQQKIALHIKPMLRFFLFNYHSHSDHNQPFTLS